MENDELLMRNINLLKVQGSEVNHDSVYKKKEKRKAPAIFGCA